MLVDCAPCSRVWGQAQQKSLSPKEVEDIWVERYYEHESNFMIAYGLDPSKAGDRDKARELVKAKIKKRKSVDYTNLKSGNDAPHLRDRAFSEEELAWIKKHHRHSLAFMLKHDLDPCDNNDVQEAVQIARNLMKHERQSQRSASRL